jgi:hypothetical protein
MPVQKIGEANPRIPGPVLDVLDIMRVEAAGIAEAGARRCSSGGEN